MLTMGHRKIATVWSTAPVDPADLPYQAERPEARWPPHGGAACGRRGRSSAPSALMNREKSPSNFPAHGPHSIHQRSNPVTGSPFTLGRLPPIRNAVPSASTCFSFQTCTNLGLSLIVPVIAQPCAGAALRTWGQGHAFRVSSGATGGSEAD